MPDDERHVLGTDLNYSESSPCSVMEITQPVGYSRPAVLRSIRFSLQMLRHSFRQ
jgi:hypothetical protein